MTYSLILKTISRILLPFVIIFGFYIILNGDTSPGGGFQGGVVLATGYLLLYFIKQENSFDLSGLLKIYKLFFMVLLGFVSISALTRGIPFTNFFPQSFEIETRRIYLIGLDLIIGLNVAIGLISVFTVFLEEGHK